MSKDPWDGIRGMRCVVDGAAARERIQQQRQQYVIVEMPNAGLAKKDWIYPACYIAMIAAALAWVLS